MGTSRINWEMDTTKSRAYTAIVGILILAILGCSNNTTQETIDQRQAAQQAYDQSLEALARGDIEAAKPLLDKVIELGTLPIDLRCSAYVKRAVCLAISGDFESAHADLDEMEKGAPNMDEVLSARSFVFEKQGKTRESKAAWAKARQLNRYVARIKI